MRRLHLVVLVALAALGLSALPALGAPSALDPVTISGSAGEKPALAFSTPFAVKRSESKVLQPGTGDRSKPGSTVTFDYVVVDGRTGAELAASYGSTPIALTLANGQTSPALVEALIGVAPGARVLVAVAPRDGFPEPAPGMKKTDTVLFVFDVKTVTTPLTRAQGQAVPPAAGLPTVRLSKAGAPTITVPRTPAPKTLVVQPLIVGTGPQVQAGDTVKLQYSGVLWDGGKVVQSSWKTGPVTVPVGTGGVIKAWDAGLVGRPIGSQVLLVVPPDEGYGPGGNPQVGVTGTDTLVFVIDILDAGPPAASSAAGN